MKKEIIVQLNKTFEESAYTQNGVEYWMARDIQKLLDYTEWRNFLLVIDKAKIACMNSMQNIGDHFVDVNKMVKLCSCTVLEASHQSVPESLSKVSPDLIKQVRF